MAWIEPTYSVPDVNRAGRVLVNAMDDDWPTWTDDQWREYRKHLAVINNWRGSHAYPLNTFQVNLRATARRFDETAIVAQRIKRLASIGQKLHILRSMKLSQMQDIGGCRAIFSTISLVAQATRYYVRESSVKHELVSIDDYIKRPKVSGYRGVHLVYRYVSDKNKAIYNGLKIEMQLRSRYQHAWATAVETVGTFSGEALKSSLGSERWQKFFLLMSTAIATRERSYPAPNTPTGRSELMEELTALAAELRVSSRLREYGNALKSITSPGAREGSAKLYLLELDPIAGTLNVTGFGAHEQELASQKYAESEARQAGDSPRDAVLVSVESVTALSRAFPNYFADTRLFVELLNQFLIGRSRGIVVPDRQLDLPL